jgi:hypothetical protein
MTRRKFESPVSKLEKQNAPRENECDAVPYNQWRVFQEEPIAKPKGSPEHEHKILPSEMSAVERVFQVFTTCGTKDAVV